jgi:hypothetical protein
MMFSRLRLRRNRFSFSQKISIAINQLVNGRQPSTSAVDCPFSTFHPFGGQLSSFRALMVPEAVSLLEEEVIEGAQSEVAIEC